MLADIGWNLPTLACVLTLLGGGRYWYVARQPHHPATPNIGTWMTWTSVGLLTAIGMWSAGTLSLMVIASVGFNCAIVMVALRGSWKPLQPIERWCLGAAATGLVLFVYYQDTCPEIAIIIGVTISVLGSVPTILTIWKQPHREDPWAHACGNTSCLVQLFAHSGWSVTTDLQPLIWLLNGLVMTSLIARPRFKLVLRHFMENSQLRRT